jgi:hypothetical protein
MSLLRALCAVSGAMVVLVSSLLVVGCATLSPYRPEAQVTQSRYTTIENYSTSTVDPDGVDAVLTEVASAQSREWTLAFGTEGAAGIGGLARDVAAGGRR